jgi:nucleotide-binding universal stress UspA family protein
VEILICTDGSNSSLQSAELIHKLGFPATTRIVVLGVSENRDDVEKLTASMNQIDMSLGVSYILTKKIRYGNPIEEILAEALESSCDLVAVGGGRGQLGFLRPQLGSTTSKLARKLHTHFLVARNIPEQLGKILVCAGAEAPASETMKLGGEWISKTAAQIGLLHVIHLSKAGSGMRGKTEINSKEPSFEAKQPHELLLDRAGKQLRDAGVSSEIVSQIRRGLVVEEVLNVLSEGGYELLVVGAHYQPGQDRWQGTLLDDVTDQLLNRSTCSVLII